MQVKPSPRQARMLLFVAARPNRWRAALFAGLFLFAQYALATQGCMLAFDRAPEAHDAAMAEEQCGNLPMEGGICMMHCLGLDQSASAPDHHLTAAIASSSAVKPHDFLLFATRTPSRVLCDSRLHVPRTPQILYCSYQI